MLPFRGTLGPHDAVNGEIVLLALDRGADQIPDLLHGVAEIVLADAHDLAGGSKGVHELLHAQLRHGLAIG